MQRIAHFGGCWHVANFEGRVCWEVKPTRHRCLIISLVIHAPRGPLHLPLSAQGAWISWAWSQGGELCRLKALIFARGRVHLDKLNGTRR